MLLGLEVLVSRREAAALRATGLCRRWRRSGAGHDCVFHRFSTAQRGSVARNGVRNAHNDEWSARPSGRERAAAALCSLCPTNQPGQTGRYVMNVWRKKKEKSRTRRSENVIRIYIVPF